MHPVQRILILFVILGGAATATASPETPEDFVRVNRARLAVSADHGAVQKDVDRVLAAHGQDGTWVRAIESLSEAAHQAGERELALDLLQRLADARRGTLEETASQRILRAALLLLRTQDSFRHADGHTYVPIPMASDGSTQAARSPLEQKIRRLFLPLADTAHLDDKGRSRIRSSIEAQLRQAGPSVVPILARIVEDQPGESGAYAAQMLISFGGAEAIPHVEHLVRSADGITRAAVLRYLPRRHDDLAVAYDALLQRLDSHLRADERAHVLRAYRFPRMSQAELLAWHEADKTMAIEALIAGMDYSRAMHAPTLERAVSVLVDAAPDAHPELYEAAARWIGNAATRDRARFVLDQIDVPLLHSLAKRYDPTLPTTRRPPAGAMGNRTFGALVQSLERRRATALPELLHEVVRRSAAVMTVDNGRPRLPGLDWLGVLERTLPHPVMEDGHVLRVLLDAGEIPHALLQRTVSGSEEAFLATVRVLSKVRSGAQDDLFRMLVREAAARAETTRRVALLGELVEVLPRLELKRPPAALQHLIDVQDKGGIEGDREAWWGLLTHGTFWDASHHAGYRERVIGILVRERDERILPELTEGNGAWFLKDRSVALLRSLRTWGEPRICQAWKQAFLQGAYATMGGRRAVTKEMALWAQESPEALADVRHILAEAPPAHIEGFIPWLHDLGLEDEFVRIVKAAIADPDAWAPAAFTLFQQVMQHRPKETIPFLLSEYKRTGGQKHIAEALDGIRAYHDRLRQFESWMETDGKDEVGELMKLLQDENATTRRAAVLGLTALEAKQALPALVRMSTGDADPAVRQAALHALESLAGLR